MISDLGYIYIRYHPSYDIYDACKLGITNNIPNRDHQYSTGEITRGIFEHVYKIQNKLNFVDKLLKNELLNYNIKFDAGIEFYNKQIINFIEQILLKNNIQFNKLTKDEINNLVRINKKLKIDKEKKIIKTKITKQQFIKKINQINKKYNINDWNEREYQTEIIKYSINKLNEENKIYIELATGGGKTYIVYNLFKLLDSEFIVICSPRKIINSQNVSSKYLQILKYKYKIFNYSINSNLEKFLKLKSRKIIICCTQSINKISTLLKNINNITAWFDEAHYAIEDYDINNFWLSNQQIKYRIFTSASPCILGSEDAAPGIINKNIFGILYKPITVRQLINLKYLSDVKTYIYSETKSNINSIKNILDDFTNYNRHYGFSFHNKQINAFSLFYNHYNEYINNKTFIKPFLLVGDDFKTEKEINLNYKFRDIKEYENNKFSIGYVVARYSIGYDFNKLDFIIFMDPKVSISDIKQCIGRGLRLYENKYLMISLPVFIDIDDRYNKIIEVLKYLIHDIEIDISDIKFINRTKKEIEINKKDNNINYSGEEDIKTILLNLLQIDERKNITYSEVKKIIAKYNIKTKEEYYNLCQNDFRLYRDPIEIFKEQFINWIDYLGIQKKYYEIKECQNKITEYLIIYPELKNHNLELLKITNQLCKIDDRFPPYDLWTDYYNINDLTEIIKITITKKKNLIIL